MPLNPQVETVLGMFANLPKVDHAVITAAQMRAMNDTPFRLGEALKVAQAEDLEMELAGRRLAGRLYVPEGAESPAPLLVYYHGGGWVIGTLETHDNTCRALARTSGAAVLSVAYRLAPEHPYPAPLEDCYAALEWAEANAAALGCDPLRLAVGGDSAGGNLAAAVAIMARDRKGPALRHQLLIYPVIDDDLTLPSYTHNGGGEYFLGTATMRWFWDQYLAGQADTPLAQVGRTPDLSGLPPASVYAAEFDPLRDEGMAYAQRLKAAGGDVDAAVAPGMIHGFFSMFEFVPDALPWIERAGARLRGHLA